MFSYDIYMCILIFGDVLHKFYNPMLFALRKVDASSWEETNAKKEMQITEKAS